MKKAHIVLISVGVVTMQAVMALITGLTGGLYLLSMLSSIFETLI